MKKVVIALTILLSLPSISNAQNQKKYIGANFAADKNFASNLNLVNSTTVGFFFESYFAKHWSYEFGANMRTTYYPEKQYSIRTNSLIIPVSMKFNSKVVNVGVTGYLDLYLNWKDLTNNTASIQIPTYDSDKYSLGVQLNVSKTIAVTKGLYVEPYIMGGTTLYSDIIVGLGVRLKVGFR